VLAASDLQVGRETWFRHFASIPIHLDAGDPLLMRSGVWLNVRGLMKSVMDYASTSNSVRLRKFEFTKNRVESDFFENVRLPAKGQMIIFRKEKRLF
jgi:hypothetical protein